MSLRENKNTTAIPPNYYIYVYCLNKSHPIMKFLLLENTFFKKNSFFCLLPTTTTTTNIVVPYLKKHKTIQIFFWKKYSYVKSVLIWSPFCFFLLFQYNHFKIHYTTELQKKNQLVYIFSAQLIISVNFRSSNIEDN